jgi:hypothetical protein
MLTYADECWREVGRLDILKGALHAYLRLPQYLIYH